MDPEDRASLILMTREEIIHHVSIALAVLRPPVQIGRGRKLPDESDRDRRMAAALLAEHFEMSGFRMYRGQPIEGHGGGFGRPEPSNVGG